MASPMHWILLFTALAGCTKSEPADCMEGTMHDESDHCIPEVQTEDSGGQNPEQPTDADADDSGQAEIPVDDTIVKLVAGIDHSCALRADGLLNCWGCVDLVASTPTFPVLDVTAQGWHTCIIDLDQRLICWGDNEFGQATFPTEGTYSAVSAGVAHTCALSPAGEITCWGVSDDDPLFGHGQVSKAPTGPGFHSMVSGKLHSCALDPDNEVHCWGPDDGGTAQLHGDPVDVGQVTDAPTGTPESVSTEYWGGCALNADGTLQSWGLAFYLPSADFKDYQYTTIDGGGLHSCGIRVDGTIGCWGDDAHEQVSDTPDGVFGLIGVGEKHACAVDADNRVTCWGRNRYGEALPPE